MDFHKFINIVKLGRGLAYAAMLVYVLGVLSSLSIGTSFDVPYSGGKDHDTY